MRRKSIKIQPCFNCEVEAETVTHFVVPEKLGGKSTVELCTDCFEKAKPIVSQPEIPLLIKAQVVELNTYGMAVEGIVNFVNQKNDYKIDIATVEQILATN